MNFSSYFMLIFLQVKVQISYDSFLLLTLKIIWFVKKSLVKEE